MLKTLDVRVWVGGCSYERERENTPRNTLLQIKSNLSCSNIYIVLDVRQFDPFRVSVRTAYIYLIFATRLPFANLEIAISERGGKNHHPHQHRDKSNVQCC